MERNAWRVAHDIALRIDDAPVLLDYIRAFVTERDEEAFFFQQDPANVPGYNYFAKICGHINGHSDAEELYMEFVKDTSKVYKKEQQCTSCENGWLAP